MKEIAGIAAFVALIASLLARIWKEQSAGPPANAALDDASSAASDASVPAVSASRTK